MHTLTVLRCWMDLGVKPSLDVRNAESKGGSPGRWRHPKELDVQPNSTSTLLAPLYYLPCSPVSLPRLIFYTSTGEYLFAPSLSNRPTACVLPIIILDKPGGAPNTRGIFSISPRPCYPPLSCLNQLVSLRGRRTGRTMIRLTTGARRFVVNLVAHSRRNLLVCVHVTIL